ncbi:MAG TPA: OprD family outer membrane porin [Sulfurovum sp.]|uniref:OprD family outer membrane porin n=1 Tax=Sulfurovum sp. TaxID=1969726 RepID=UPI002F9545BC
MTSLCCVNSSAEETRWGRFDTHIELFHYDIDAQNDEESKATVLGGYIDYRSKPLYGFGFGVKQYLSHLIFESKNPALTSLTDTAGNDINPLSECYAYYKNTHTAFKIGKQQIHTPMLNDDTTRLVPFSYQGITSQIFWDSDTFLSLGHVTRFRPYNAEAYSEYTSSGLAEEGVSYIGFHTQFGNARHQWYYYHAPKLFNTLHMEVEARTPLNPSADIYYGMQGIYTFDDQGGIHILNRDNGGGDVKLVAAKLGLRSEKFSYTGSLSYNFGNDGINRGYGGLSSIYTSSMIAQGKTQGHPFAKSLKVHYRYFSASKDKAYSSSLYLTNITYRDDTYNTLNALYIDHKFKFRPREYILLRYEKQWIANEDDKSYLRIISAYTF